LQLYNGRLVGVLPKQEWRETVGVVKSNLKSRENSRLKSPFFDRQNVRWEGRGEGVVLGNVGDLLVWILLRWAA
jgi:hypothetical protein